jgi:hypothetical protein
MEVERGQATSTAISIYPRCEHVLAARAAPPSAPHPQPSFTHSYSTYSYFTQDALTTSYNTFPYITSHPCHRLAIQQILHLSLLTLSLDMANLHPQTLQPTSTPPTLTAIAIGNGLMLELDVMSGTAVRPRSELVWVAIVSNAADRVWESSAVI